MFDIKNQANCKAPIYVEMNEKYAFYGTDMIKKEREIFKTDKDGVLATDLIETETMTADTGKDIYYTLTIPDIKYTRNFTIPKGTISSNFLDLPVYGSARC
jgi:hypothetical protein